MLGPVDNLDEMPNPDVVARARREVLKELKCLLGQGTHLLSQPAPFEGSAAQLNARI
jgi:hypothetical protein